MPVRRYLFSTDTVSRGGRGLAFLKGERKGRFCRREHDHTVGIKKEQESNTHRGCMASPSSVDVMTPLVRYIETFVFSEVQ